MDPNSGPPTAAQIADLQERVDQLTVEKDQLFNHPVVRGLRGLKNIKNRNFQVGFRDLRASAVHIIRRRPIARAKPTQIDLKYGERNPLMSMPQGFTPPAVFFHKEYGNRRTMVVGSSQCLSKGGESLVVTPSNWRQVLQLNPRSLVHVELRGPGLADTPWNGLFSIDNMRLLREFSLMCDFAASLGSTVEIWTERDSDYPLVKQVTGVQLRGDLK